MKRTIAGLIAGLVLGSAGTVVAASQAWSKRSAGVYSCSGYSQAVHCKSDSYIPRYKVSIIQNLVIVSFGGSEIFSCYTSRRPGACADLR